MYFIMHIALAYHTAYTYVTGIWFGRYFSNGNLFKQLSVYYYYYCYFHNCIEIVDRLSCVQSHSIRFILGTFNTADIPAKFSREYAEYNEPTKLFRNKTLSTTCA